VQALVREELGRPATRSLLVMESDQLADDPERDELDTGYDEEHPKREQGPVADRLADQLQHRQVGERDRSDDRKH
jgi:hypothetical protein